MHGPFAKEKFDFIKGFKNQNAHPNLFGKVIFCFITCPPKQTLEIFSECGVVLKRACTSNGSFTRVCTRDGGDGGRRDE